LNLSSKHYLAAIIWCALIGVTYLVMDRVIAPKVVKVTMEREIRVPRSHDGHFYIAGTINNQPVEFLVDTGATTTAVSAEMARKIGLARGQQITVHTANGTTQGEESSDNTIVLGGITISGVNVITLSNMDGYALLGQNVLNHLQITQTPEGMVLRAVNQ
jgi:aspartyl protease family protein